MGLFLVVFLAPAFAQAPGWVLYTHPDKLMSVRFPGKPTETDQEASAAGGTIHFKLVTFGNDDRGYVAGASLYPNAAALNVPKALDGARDQMLANIKGKVVSEKPVKLDGVQGREVRFEAPGPNNSRLLGVARVFASAKPPGTYMAIAMHLTGKPDPDAQKFLDSLHLGKKVETKP